MDINPAAIPPIQGVTPSIDLHADGKYFPQFKIDARTMWCMAMIPHVVAIIFSAINIARRHGSGNLADFLGAAHDMLAGKDIYNGGTGGYVYPPLIAFLYQPLAMMSIRAAAFTSLAINASLSIYTLVLISHVSVRRLLGKTDPLLVASVAFFGAVATLDKIKGEFAHLETNVFMLLAFTVAMKCVDKRPWLCGLALGFAFNIKYMPLVLAPYLLLRQRWGALAWFAVWALFFAILPATSMGWKANAHAWTEAYGGLFNLFGLPSSVHHAAHLRKITDLVSISLTSGLARTTGLAAPWPLAIASGLAMLFVAYIAILYTRNRIPLFRWPSVRRQALPPYRGLISIEWIGILLLTLIFSPFTNSRHLYMLLDVNIAAGTLLLGGAGIIRRTPLVIGTAVMMLGISLPPGGIHAVEPADQFWRGIGGPGWCMLAMVTVLIWTNVQFQRAAVQQQPMSGDC